MLHAGGGQAEEGYTLVVYRPAASVRVPSLHTHTSVPSVSYVHVSAAKCWALVVSHGTQAAELLGQVGRWGPGETPAPLLGSFLVVHCIPLGQLPWLPSLGFPWRIAQPFLLPHLSPRSYTFLPSVTVLTGMQVGRGCAPSISRTVYS